MDNRGKEARVYGMLKDGVFGGFCSLCGARIPKYRNDYHGKKICANCHAELVPWDEKGADRRKRRANGKRGHVLL